MSLTLGDRTFTGISRGLLTAISGFFRRKLQDDEHTNSIALPEALQGDAVKYVLDYLTKWCKTKGFFSLKPAGSPATNAAIYQVFQVIEMPTFARGIYLHTLEAMEQHVELPDVAEWLNRLDTRDQLYKELVQQVVRVRFCALAGEKEPLEK